MGASLGIFISYASKDRKIVRRFEAALRGRRPGLSCFFDERGLTGGVYWIPKLGEELGKADMVLLLLGGILPICKMAMSFPLLPRSRIRSATWRTTNPP
jgi:hypothetical protein